MSSDTKRSSADQKKRTQKLVRLLFKAINEGNIGKMELLLAQDSNLATTSDKNKNTALHIASAAGHLNIVRRLVEGYALRIDVDNWNKKTPAMLAMANGHFHVSHFLFGRNEQFDKASKKQAR